MDARPRGLIDRQLDKEDAERQRLEEALKASDQELKDFIYMTSHDFREPLRKITSFGAILKESLEGRIQPEDRENLDFMIDGAERMTQMIEDLLAYSRIHTRILAIEKIHLNEVVEQLQRLDLAKVLEDTCAHVEVPEPLFDIQADPILIRQLLRNLMIHAIKHCKKDSHLKIVIRTEHTMENEVKVECEDNGVGIEVKNDKNLFKMSLQSHLRQEYEEAGTGLAVCKKIVDRHGGRIGITSKAGAGSILWFTLPASKPWPPEQDELIVNRTGSPTLS
jgi:light-regulated signal transduction histidine kinase (bacteriophytochrome)